MLRFLSNSDNSQKFLSYEAYFGVNPADPFSSLTDEGREKAMDYINLLHASGMYEKQTAKIIPFRSIDIFENAVSAGTGNFLISLNEKYAPIKVSENDRLDIFGKVLGKSDASAITGHCR